MFGQTKKVALIYSKIYAGNWFAHWQGTQWSTVPYCWAENVDT